MTSISANNIFLEYREEGRPTDPAVILVRGLGTQLIDWPEAFVTGLTGAGFRVICFDNRDVGLSRHFDESGWPNLSAISSGDLSTLAYRLEDMANDIIGLMDSLAIRVAHVAGISMGGMIVQLVAAMYPDRVMSMASIMSSSGRAGLPGPSEEASAALQSGVADRNREEVIADTASGLLITGSPGYPQSEATRRQIAAARYDRNYDPAGVARQMAAVVANGSREETLASIKVPSLVIHGASDPLIPIEAGIDTARCIPGSKFVRVEGMGHNIPEALVAELCGLLQTHFTGST